VDSFTRTGTNGWGTADTGGVWTPNSSASAFSTNGTSGRISLTAGATRQNRLDAVSTVNADMRVDVSINRVPDGNVFAYLVARRTGTDTEYRAKVRIASDGSVWLQPTKAVANAVTALGPELQVAGLTVAANTKLAVRVQYVGSSPTLIRMRAWNASGSEPSTWTASQTDSQAQLQPAGGIALRAYLASNVTGAAVVVSFDDLVVTP
jgi:hypothetical protein